MMKRKKKSGWYSGGTASTPTAGILIPGYIYPSSAGNSATFQAFYALVDAYPTVPIYFIINPNSGPGTEAKSDYQGLINRLRSRNINVIAYVYTDYGSRSVEDVKADIDAYETFYDGITGIFLDEMASADNQTIIDQYVDITAYCHAAGKSMVIGNCGAKPNEKYFLNATADNILIFESDNVPTEAQLQCTYSGRLYPKYKRSVLVHSQAAYDADLMKLCADNCSMVYITEDVMTNPWDTFSGYMENMLQYLAGTGTGTQNNWIGENW